MGIASLRRLLDPRPVDLHHFQDRTVAVDGNNLLWSFVTAMGARGAPPTGPDGAPIGHVIGLLGRLKVYADHRIRSVWVFDGAQPALKEATLAARSARIEAAREAGATAAAVSLEHGDLRDARDLLTALGVPWTTAPGEADAQCAHLTRTGAAWAAVTQDYDIALHGAPFAGRNLTAGKRAPEVLDLEAALGVHGLTREDLVDVAILVGTDYNDGVHGVGPVKALKLVQQEGGLDGALAKLDATIPDADAVRDLFLKHPVEEAWTPRFREPDEARVADLLEGWGLSSRRARAAADSLRSLHAPP